MTHHFCPKNIMKLSQGEYVAVEKIENLYSISALISQMFVHGDSLKSYLIAVVVADPVQLAALIGRSLGIHVSADNTAALEELCYDERLVDAVLAEITKEARHLLNGCVRSKLETVFVDKYKFHARFEIVKRIHLTVKPFSIDNGTITPTLKLRRSVFPSLSLGTPHSNHVVLLSTGRTHTRCTRKSSTPCIPCQTRPCRRCIQICDCAAHPLQPLFSLSLSSAIFCSCFCFCGFFLCFSGEGVSDP